MRSARILLATAAASAVLAVTAPGAHAAAGDWDHDDSSYSKEHHKGGSHDGPRGGMHTGGGALAAPAVTAGGLAVLAVAGTGLYAVRRKKSHGLA
ncbi:hypothetical protein ACFYO2_13885 [Streptomyces sp. NPDC006602]|uniref:hypothetical protein n=1 Tax=Streptomyces sp. NPDC006602 TaxID=3364751 RepID=UPI0036A4FE66